MISDPKEKMFAFWVNSIVTNNYVFKELSINYSPSSILDLKCNKFNSTRVDCVISILGGYLKKMEILVKNGDYEVVQYTNYKSYADYVPVQIAFKDEFFASYAFSATQANYGLMVYKTGENEDIYFHTFFEIPLTINNKENSFRFSLLGKNLKEKKLFFTTLNSNDPLRIYEVKNLTLDLEKPLNNIDKNSIIFTVNKGQLNFSLNDILVKPSTAIALGQILLFTLISVSAIVFICAFVFIFKSKKSKFEKEEERKLAIIEEEKEERKKELMNKLTDEQKEVLERQKGFDFVRERDMMRDSMDTITEFEEAVVC